ncbi:hypothetical protein KI387_004959, partial [Taxus chinensis]
MLFDAAVICAFRFSRGEETWTPLVQDLRPVDHRHGGSENLRRRHYYWSHSELAPTDEAFARPLMAKLNKLSSAQQVSLLEYHAMPVYSPTGRLKIASSPMSTLVDDHPISRAHTCAPAPQTLTPTPSGASSGSSWRKHRDVSCAFHTRIFTFFLHGFSNPRTQLFLFDVQTSNTNFSEALGDYKQAPLSSFLFENDDKSEVLMGFVLAEPRERGGQTKSCTKWLNSEDNKDKLLWRMVNYRPNQG